MLMHIERSELNMIVISFSFEINQGVINNKILWYMKCFSAYFSDSFLQLNQEKVTQKNNKLFDGAVYSRIDVSIYILYL